MEKEFKDINEANTSEVYGIDGVEIFKTGKWNGDKYTEKDLDEMEKSFKEIGQEIKPYLKLGHNKSQKLLASDGMPAAGWVANVRREGQSLVADFKNMPKKIYELIKKGAYGRMSSEIYWNLKHAGKDYKRVLKAVALLGADTPAVSSLDDFINLYTENNIECEIIKNYHELKDINMDELKIYQEKMDSLESQLKEYSEIKAENDDLKSQVKEYSDKIGIMEAEKAKMELEKKKADVKHFIEAKVKEGKILPSQVAMYTQLAMEEKTYSIDEKEMSALEMVESIVDQYEAQVDFSEGSRVGDDAIKDDEKALEKKIKAYADENNVSYEEAYIVVGGE